MEKRLKDLIPTRRDVLKLGGVALASTWVERIAGPTKVYATGKANPRGTARFAILVEMGGCISPMDCWDLKETKWTPKDLDVQKIQSDLSVSRTLFPMLTERKHWNKMAVVRSLRASELIHFNGQYHTQTGRSLNPAIAKEIPAFGSVIAAELDHARRESDRFPTYVSTGMTRAAAGSIGAGLFPARFSGLDLDPTTIFDAFSGNADGVNAVLDERWNMLAAVAQASAAERASIGQVTSDYLGYYKEAYGLLNDKRWTSVFKASDDDKQRYGGATDLYAMGLILARNLLDADAGTRFVYVNDGAGWDHHSYIFDHSKPRNHYVSCTRFDKGITALLEDLEKMPSKHTPGKTLLDETMIVCTSEFGRTPFINNVAGRDHWRTSYSTLYFGGGVKGGRMIGRTDPDGGTVIDTGWAHKEQPHMDNTVASIYSALGIDWRKKVEHTPSGRAYEYTQTAPLTGNEFFSDDEIAELFV